MKGQKGFTLVVTLLAIIVFALVGGVGYYVYDSRKDDNSKSIQTVEQPKTEMKQPEQKDPTADWKSYKDKDGLYEFKYPVTWVFAKNPDLCNPGLVLFGSNADSVGACASESFGQMSVEARKGDLLRSDYELLEDQYKDIKSDSVNVAGVAGLKQLGTFNPVGEVVIGPAAGDKKLIYIFQDKGYTYAASYYIPKDGRYPDAQADFELLVNKTLKFKQ